MEMAQAVGTTLSGSVVSGNGKDGQQYNGDGVGLNGTGGSVVDDTITDNGDGAGFEHGIYAGPTATGYTISATRSATMRAPTSRPPAGLAWSPTTASPPRCSGS